MFLIEQIINFAYSKVTGPLQKDKRFKGTFLFVGCASFVHEEESGLLQFTIAIQELLQFTIPIQELRRQNFWGGRVRGGLAEAHPPFCIFFNKEDVSGGMCVVLGSLPFGEFKLTGGGSHLDYEALTFHGVNGHDL